MSIRSILLAPLAVAAVSVLGGCATQSAVQKPTAFTSEVVQTRLFPIQTWHKITEPGGFVRVYIEGDGHAYNAHGHPAMDPTPHGTLVRDLAFNDPDPNVVYIARPCQFVKNERCKPAVWTTARFSRAVIQSVREAVQATVGSSRMTLIGYSGGAQVAGLVAVTSPELKVVSLVTIAGNLDHPTWTAKHKLDPLTGSMSLTGYKERYLRIAQRHFVGEDDTVIEPELVENFVGGRAPVTRVKGATHDNGWESIIGHF